MTLKNPTVWNPQPIGYGPESLTTTQAASKLVDQTGNFLVDQSGNFLVTGVNVPQAKIPIAWADTGV